MRIVVTGGSGFIGRTMVPGLLTEGHHVAVLARNPETAGQTMDGRVTFVQWDGKSPGPWSEHVDGADAVLNFAGEPIGGKRWSAKQKRRIVESRVNATNAIVDAIGKATRKPSVLINASAVGFYGPVEQGDVVEEYPRGDTFLSEAVDQWERAALGAGKFNVRVVLLRSGVVLGKDGGALERMLVPFRMFVGGSIGSGRQWFPWVHVDDLVHAVLFALTNRDVIGPVNVAAPQSVTMKQFCNALGNAMHRPSWAPVPGFVLKMALGEMSSMVLTGQRVVPKALERHGYVFKFPLLTPALVDILK